MITRKSLLVFTSAMILLIVLSGCMAGAVSMPDRDVEISNQAAIEAQNALLAGAAQGSVELTESQFSSLLTVLATQDPTGQIPIEGVKAHFTPDKLYLTLELDQAMLGVDSIGVTGNVSVENNLVVIDLDDAMAGPFHADGNLVDFIGDRITAALNHPALGTIVGIEMGEGTLALSMGQ